MAKPSIFSRDYEKRMKKRRRRVIFLIILICVVILTLTIKMIVPNIDFSNMRTRLQEWVDSGRSEEDIQDEPIIDNEESSTPQKEEEVVVEPEKQYMDLAVSEDTLIKATYIEENGVKKFTEVENKEGYSYDISPTANRVIITTPNQDLKLFNIDGTDKIVTKDVHVDTRGVAYLKYQVLEQMPNFIWNNQVKFIDDQTIIYISELPYFGQNLVDKYLWIKNVDTFTNPEYPNDIMISNIIGNNITIGSVENDKGIEVNVDGNIYYINANGEIVP